jgi:hypothetical protein
MASTLPGHARLVVYTFDHHLVLLVFGCFRMILGRQPSYLQARQNLRYTRALM